MLDCENNLYSPLASFIQTLTPYGTCTGGGDVTVVIVPLPVTLALDTCLCQADLLRLYLYSSPRRVPIKLSVGEDGNVIINYMLAVIVIPILPVAPEVETWGPCGPVAPVAPATFLPNIIHASFT